MKLWFPDSRLAPLVFSLVAVAMSGCAGDEPASSTAVPPARPAYKIQGFLPDATGAPDMAAALAGQASERTNDPSAPLDTPLCGTAAREANAVAASVAPAVVSSGNACVQTACFDALTDTYIGADGYRHICQ